MNKCPKCKKSDEVVTRPDGTQYCLDCGERVASAPSDATACSSVEFRLLNQSDTIEPDDEFLTDDCQTWAKVGDEAVKFMIGKIYSATFFQPMRRKTYPMNSELSQTASRDNHAKP